MTQASKIFAAAGLALAIGTALPAQAAVIDLGFILDESGSISSSEFGIIRSGLSTAINTLVPIGGADSYRITVVKFDDTAEVVVNKVLINSAAARTSVANAINAMSQQGGATNYLAAFDLMRTTLGAGIGTAYVNFATDGEPNRGGWDPAAAGVTARNALIAAGVDNISIEGIGVTGSAAAYLQNSICYPGPCDTTVPYNFPAQGFYIGVANATAYASAIQNKIRIVTGTVPEPGTLVLLALGAIGFGVGRRAKRA